MAVSVTSEWFRSLPPCQAQVPCGPAQHELRWEAGAVVLPAHPDAEAELVLAALGGERAGCVQLAQAWSRHTADLTVLAVGPRDRADVVTVGWEQVREAAQPHGHPGWAAMAGPPAPGVRFPMRPGHGPQQLRQAFQAEREQARQRATDQLSLLALGTPFQWRLAGHVAATHAWPGGTGRVATADRPALTAALTSRLAPAVADWIGTDPGRVLASLHDGTGWGTLQLTRASQGGTGQGGAGLTAALPAGWLACVWACGLALVAGHLVVGVTRAGWPDAQVLALRSPGADPVLLDVHGIDGDIPHWEPRRG
jgi:hypothetical protein